MQSFHPRQDYLAWGRVHRFTHHVARPAFADELPGVLAARGTMSLLGSGARRSYGDSGLNADNALIDMRGLDHVIAFDAATGVLDAEAGVILADILHLLARPANGAGTWFLPVTPGTKFVSLGGAIASDVHGKNHHGAGCIGNHLLSFRLLRSDGATVTCSPDENADLFKATIGGLGLTGLIVSVRVALKRVPGPWLEHEEFRYGDLNSFYRLAEESLADWEYTVAWIDCLASGAELGRGIFARSRHADASTAKPAVAAVAPRIALPVDLPSFALNSATVKAYNNWRWRSRSDEPVRHIVPFEPAFYPLDAIGQWNRLYGSRGFFQYQFVVPSPHDKDAIRAVLTEISRAGMGSFLAVLKTFGDRPSPGMMSFPMPGTTLALDFPNTGARTHALLDRLDDIVIGAGGRIYAAKDGRMSAKAFQQGYPMWQSFARQVDPHFSSSFWRRVTEGAG